MTGARGRYAKGEQRRARILETALEVFTSDGFHASSTKEIARRVGVTEPTLFHYFGSKQALLAAVLAARDERSSPAGTVGESGTDGPGSADGPDGACGVERLLAAVRDNADEPGLVRLFAVTSAEATDPDHAAHAWFAGRYARLRAELAERPTERPTGRNRPGLDPDRVARLLLAAADGLQIQWLLDRAADDPEGIDMAADLRALADALGLDGGTGESGSATR